MMEDKNKLNLVVFKLYLYSYSSVCQPVAQNPFFHYLSIENKYYYKRDVLKSGTFAPKLRQEPELQNL